MERHGPRQHSKGRGGRRGRRAANRAGAGPARLGRGYLGQCWREQLRELWTQHRAAGQCTGPRHPTGRGPPPAGDGPVASSKLSFWRNTVNGTPRKRSAGRCLVPALEPVPIRARPECPTLSRDVFAKRRAVGSGCGAAPPCGPAPLVFLKKEQEGPEREGLGVGVQSLPPQTFVEGLWPGHVTSPTRSPCPPPELRPDAGCWARARLRHVVGGCRAPLSIPPISFSQWALSPRSLGSRVTPRPDANQGGTCWPLTREAGSLPHPRPPQLCPAAVTATAGLPLKHGTPGAPASLPQRPLAGESNRKGQKHVCRAGILLPQRGRRAGPPTHNSTQGDGQQTSPVHPGHRGHTKIPKPTAHPT